MRIWRDIPSGRAIARIASQIAAPSAGQAGASSTMQLLASVCDRVDRYHQIRKDALAQLPQRLNALRQLAAFIESRVDPAIGGGHASHTLSGGARTVNEMLRGLARRAKAKAGYLALLIDYYSNNAGEVANPQTLIDRIRQRQTRSDDGRQLGVVPGVRMEAWDPAHRGWEMAFIEDDAGDVHINPMGKTHQSFAARWLTAVRQGTCTEPLLVYLEATEHCVDREMAKQAHTVPYMDVRSGGAPVYMLRVQGRQVEQWKADGSDGSWKLFDTTWVTKADSAKGGAIQALAYNWTTQKELFADLHNPERGRNWDTFHHSSFTGGDVIRCAGMIAGANGKIVHIDNDSGHYQPGTAHLHRLVKHLAKRGAFADGAIVQDKDPALRDFPASRGIPFDLYVQDPKWKGRARSGAVSRPPPPGFNLGGHRTS